MTTSPPDWAFVRRHPAHLVAFGFGVGLAPRAPGTVGTLLAFPLHFLLQYLPQPLAWVALAVLLVSGVAICGRTGRALGVHDHGGIVWDEVVAFACVLSFVPPTVVGFAVAFGLFRLFDIWKPFPIAWLDARVVGGLGVMLDDVVAAIYSILVLLAVRPWM